MFDEAGNGIFLYKQKRINRIKLRTSLNVFVEIVFFFHLKFECGKKAFY